MLLLVDRTIELVRGAERGGSMFSTLIYLDAAILERSAQRRGRHQYCIDFRAGQEIAGLEIELIKGPSR